MIVKICGMRDADNIRAVERLGIDWMGFIFFSGSPRYVGEELSYIPSGVKRVGVFVNELPERVRAIVSKNRLQIIQLHGSESPDYCHSLRASGFIVVKAFGMESEKPFPSRLVEQYEGSCDYYLFDTGTKQHGGSGKKFSWEMLTTYSGETPFLLSGGITPDDVEAVKTFAHPQFDGVDLNSGFETAAAIKDIFTLRRFMAQLRS